MRRGYAVYRRHCEERSDEAIHSFFTPLDGLLRFARNDEMPETGMTKTAFEKIKAGLEETKAYLDALPKKRDDEARKLRQK